MSKPSLVDAGVSPTTWRSKLINAWKITRLHALKHTGVGLICAVAYFDPGNWGVDLQGGSQYGYKLLFVVLVAGLFAVVLQSLASRLGCVTGLDLASHCRLLFYDRPKHKLLYRWLVLYPLYVLAEIAIISTDLAELLGSAMALVMMFPRLPLWGGVLITASDVFVILLVGDPLRNRPVRMFELLIVALVFAVLVCMVVIISKIEIQWGQAFLGYVPSKTIFQAGGLYTSIGIIGATVMPHSLFLGSALATQNRVSSAPSKELSSPSASVLHPRSSLQRVKSYLVSALRVKQIDNQKSRPQRHKDRENNTLEFIKDHLYHAIIDMVISLLGFAVLINSLILILASAVFYYGAGRFISSSQNPASLFDAHDLLSNIVGKGAALLFAIALLCSGQSSALIATVAGQIVTEGFLNLSLSPFIRRLLTRLLSLIPAIVVAAATGRNGVNQLLVASQVVLSIVLPFIIFPLVWLTSSKDIMSVRDPVAYLDPIGIGEDVERTERKPVDFSVGKVVTGVGYAIWLIIVVANAYVIVMLCLGKSG